MMNFSAIKKNFSGFTLSNFFSFKGCTLFAFIFLLISLLDKGLYNFSNDYLWKGALIFSMLLLSVAIGKLFLKFSIRKVFLIILHVGIMFIFLFLLIAEFFNKEYTMNLIQTKEQHIALDLSGNQLVQFPYSVSLVDIKEECNESGIPVHYEAGLLIKMNNDSVSKVLMVNHPVHYHGYDFYLQDYDATSSLNCCTVLLVKQPLKPFIIIGLCLIVVGFCGYYIIEFLNFKRIENVVE